MGSPVTLELLTLFFVQLCQMAEASHVSYLRQQERFQRTYTQYGGYKGKTGYSILHILLDLGMYGKSFKLAMVKWIFREGKGIR